MYFLILGDLSVLRHICFVASSLFFANLVSSYCHAELISSWNFNNIPAITTAGTPAALGITSIASTGGSQASTISLANYAGNIDDFGGSAINAVGSDVAGASLSLIGGGNAAPFPGNGSSIQFTVNLSGISDVVITYATQRTATGFNSNQWSWSIDGTNFTDFGSPINPATAYALTTVDFSSVAALDNVAAATFRYTFSGVTSSAGNNRIDNLQINSVPEPSSILLVGLVSGAGLAMVARRRRGK